eukprot:7387380-Prymnesium_polylepis.2
MGTTAAIGSSSEPARSRSSPRICTSCDVRSATVPTLSSLPDDHAGVNSTNPQPITLISI